MEGEEQWGCVWVGEGVSLWRGGQRRDRGYHGSCKEGAELPSHLPVMTGPVQEELLLFLASLCWGAAAC